MYKFSPTTGVFYPTGMLHIYAEAGSLPDDLIAINEQTYTKFTGQPPSGKMRGTHDGMPAWIDIPAPTNAEIAATARRYRDEFLNATDQMTLPDYSICDVPLSAALRADLLATRQAFKSWPSVQNWPQTDLPEIPHWLLIEAVNRGYRVPDWPPHPQ